MHARSGDAHALPFFSTQGSAAVDLADHAGRAGTPVLRVAPSVSAVDPHLDRPAALILDAGADGGGAGRDMDPHAIAALIPAR